MGLAWEVRGKVADGTVKLMRDMGIIHCTDISKEMPAVDSDIMYTRLFGHGEHNLYQFDDVELLEIVLEEDTVFPATKSELIEKQGWKLFDLTENEHFHARLLLERAISNYKEAIKSDPTCADAYMNIGICYDHLGDYSSANDFYDKAIDLDKNYGLAYYNKGVLLLENGDYRLALECFTKMLEIDPTNDNAKCNAQVSIQALEF